MLGRWRHWTGNWETHCRWTRRDSIQAHPKQQEQPWHCASPLLSPPVLVHSLVVPSRDQKQPPPLHKTPDLHLGYQIHSEHCPLGGREATALVEKCQETA